MDIEIIVYQSSMILFTKNEILEQIIRDYFIDRKYDLPIIEQYRDFQESSVESKVITSSSEGKLPKSVYFSPWQLQEFLQNISKEGFKEKTRNANVMHEFYLKNEKIVVNTNWTVYTPNAAELFNSMLNKMSKIATKGIQTTYYLDMYGFSKKLGPVVISAVKCHPELLLELQFKGLKHESIGRSHDIEQFAELLDTVNIDSKVITVNPEKINELTSLQAYREMIEKKTNSFIEELITFHVPLFFSERFKYTRKTSLSLVEENSTDTVKLINELGISAASIIARSVYQRWKKQMQMKYQSKLLKSDIKRIQSSGDDKLLLKRIFNTKVKT